MIRYTATDLAQKFGGTLTGDPEKAVTGFATIEEATPTDITFLANPKYAHFMEKTHAGIVLVKTGYQAPESFKGTLVEVGDPYMAFAALLQEFDKARQSAHTGIHAQSYVAETAELAEDVFVGAFASIDAGVSVGKGSKIYANVSLGKNVLVGDNTVIYPNVTIYEGCHIGSNVIIHAGTVIGSDGFGFVPDGNGVYHKIPQVGRVVIMDDVEIGANTVIDRATLGATVIHKGVKLDNLVQIAHNVVIGDHTAVAAQAGISGSTKIGEHCLIGGQVGFVGHITIAAGNKFQAQSGVAKSVTKKDGAWAGAPAFDYQQNLKSQVIFRNLPALEKRLRELEAKLAALNSDTNT